MARVLHVTFDMRIGGTEMVIKNIIEGSDLAKSPMSIFCIESPIGPWGKSLKAEGVPIEAVKRKPGFDISIVKTLRRHIIEKEIDVIHCHQYTPWVYGALASIFTKAHVVFTEHGRFYPDKKSYKRKIINPILAQCTSKITSISEATKQALVEFEYLPSNLIYVVYNGIIPKVKDIQNREKLRQELSISDDTILLGTIARFDPIKNHRMMLHAFKRVTLHNSNVKLVMVGDGDERRNIELLIKELQLENNVILIGYKENASLFIDAMDLFLLSSLSEGTSMTLLEAMVLETPCVVTDAGGNAEIIQHEEVGFVTPNGDADAFSKAIITLIDNPCLLERMKDNCLPRFNAFFHANIMNKHYSAIYEELGRHG
ncbi:glycosyl transferase family 1 [Alteromonas australica]|uniref:glycosyltransferase n=1 Tax=Alteromonas australica TaxID=589873 RepID=UPI0005C42AF4|nr:glycosyltransferase [Alteromonas australica]AJP44575.1 glycosyl transferase family 1 [Alteromonas australica]MAO29949.1 glycosyltransferase [Alteromonas sp.]MBB68340.1 glycosyltransferase [Rickettsiales bacterium]|tara:strand:+ start:1063 stop:2175 length:1113 start_codon:yes stop_codon:yes gene_type:complete